MTARKTVNEKDIHVLYWAFPSSVESIIIEATFARICSRMNSKHDNHI